MLWLALQFRDGAAGDAAALRTLACWAGRYSPTVSLGQADELLIEVATCLRLFGGLDALCAQLRADLQAMSLDAATALAAAPTPLAAQWLARGQALPQAAACRCTTLAALPAQLAPLPIAVLQLDEAATLALNAYGTRHLGELFALPRAGLARRLGTALVRQLAQALGERPDPREAFRFPERFDAGLELPAKVDAAPRLLFAAQRLLVALAGWLAARQAGVAQCTLHIGHDDAADTSLVLGFASPTRDPERLRRVLGERLARCPLPAAAVTLRLDAAAVLALPGQSAGLFGDHDAGALDAVIERLRARLGAAAVHGLRPHADHRPEMASRHDTGAPPLPAQAGAAARPLWLLPAPQPLGEWQGQPAWRGAALPTLTRDERIEGGWWDDAGDGPGDVRRDYRIATSPRGTRLWIFHDGQRWWLHGIFA